MLIGIVPVIVVIALVAMAFRHARAGGFGVVLLLLLAAAAVWSYRHGETNLVAIVEKHGGPATVYHSGGQSLTTVSNEHSHGRHSHGGHAEAEHAHAEPEVDIWARDETPAPAPTPVPAAPVVPAQAPAAVVEATVASAAASPSAIPAPAWVRHNGKLIDGVYRLSIASGLYVTHGECDRALDGALEKAVHQYVADYLGETAAERVKLEPALIREQLVKATWTEQTDASVGQMQQIHALVEFDNAARRLLAERQERAEIHERLRKVGGGTAIVLAGLAGLFGMLKLSAKRGDAVG